jgi:hypothetical protein
MYLRALTGYKKALGQKAVRTYIPALITAQNIANLFQQIGRVQKAEGLYVQALLSVKAVFGRSSDRYQVLVKALNNLRSNRGHDINC